MRIIDADKLYKHMFQHWGDVYFATKEEAEKRLEELRGNT